MKDPDARNEMIPDASESDAAADQSLPHSHQAEQGVLACIFHSSLESLEHCAALNVQPEAFYDLRNRVIYQGMVRLCMAAKPVDVISLVSNLESHHELDLAGGHSYLTVLPDKTPSAQNVGHYIEILLEKFVARQTIALCAETTSKAFQKTTDQWLSDFRDKVIQLRIGTRLEARPIGQLIRPPENDPTELIRHRFLCERGSLLINGPTGMGKSSFAMQSAALWSNGLPFFGMEPVRPLTCLFIQAENDDGDMAEMRDGIATGLKFHVEQRTNFFNRVMVQTSNGTTGRRFCNEVVQPLLISHRPNLLYIDPANSFMGGDNKEQRDVGAFLRTWLNPLLFAHNCGCVMVHHTNKPSTGKEKPNWKNGEWAYAGSGSAEWANWARAVLSVQDTGTHGVYRLHAGKRGVRLHWRNESEPDIPAYDKLIGHSKEPGLIYWRDAEENEVDSESGGRPKSYDQEELLDLLGDTGLTSGEWEREANKICAVKSRSFQRALADFQRESLVLKSKIDRKWKRIIKP